SVTAGTNTVAVAATDGSGNATTNVYEVDISGSNQTLAYDANGNLTSDGTRTFAWDAEDRLLSVVIGTKISEFTYDGFSRRVRIVEKDGGTTTSDKRFLWCGLEICEERDATGSAVTKRFFNQGVQEGGINYFYTRDHLGSVRELTDGAGTLHARYDYDPWGRRTKLAGDKNVDFGFTGHYEHTLSGLTLAAFRAYDSNLGRWISEDPSGFTDGPNRYSYASSAPTGMYDPTGELGFAAVLPLVPVISGPPGWVVGGIVAAGITLTGLYLYQKNKEAQEETARWERFVREEMKTRADKEKQKEKQKYPAADPE